MKILPHAKGVFAVPRKVDRRQGEPSRPCQMDRQEGKILFLKTAQATLTHAFVSLEQWLEMPLPAGVAIVRRKPTGTEYALVSALPDRSAAGLAKAGKPVLSTCGTERRLSSLDCHRLK